MKKQTLGRWTIEAELNIISHEDKSVQLEPLTMKMLIFMAERSDEVLIRQVLMDHLWGSTVVSNDSLNRIVSQLRKIFHQDEDITIETIRGVGYRLSESPGLNQKRRRIKEGDLKKLIVGIFVVAIAIIIIFQATKQNSEPLAITPELNEYTQLPGFLLNPSMSPDDKVMAFSWNGGEGTTFNIYLKREGVATPIKFSEGSFDLAPEWSPEGDFVAYNAYNFMEGSSSLIIKSLVGNSMRTVNGIGGMNGSSPIDWASDNKSIIIAANPVGKRRSVLHLIDMDDLSRTQLTEVSGDTTSHTTPRFSPDNKKVVFLKLNAQVNDLSPTLHTKNDLMLIDLETSEQSLLIPDLSTPFGIEWVDQENIVYINRVNGRSQLVNYSLKEGTSTVIFSSSNVSLKGFSMFNNSRKAVLEAQRSDFNIDKVILGDTTPLSKTALINFTSSDLSPTLNTRGQMAFISDYSGIEQIWLLDKGESTPTQVTYFKESSTISNPEWSPDGNEIIFSTKRTNRGLRIEKIRANGTSHKILVEGKANYDNPSWSMDNKFIYFYSDSLKVPQLFKMDLDTKNCQQITFSEGLFGRETLRGFFFVKFGEPGIWKLTEDGDEELIIEDMSYFSLSDWQVNGDTLIYLRTRNNDPALMFYDMKQKANIRKIALPDLKMPVPSLGLALNLAENELYITSSKELTSALNTLEW